MNETHFALVFRLTKSNRRSATICVAHSGAPKRVATKHDLYFALALTVRDRVFQRTVGSLESYGGADARRVAYLSAEYLPGPHLANNLLNLGITEADPRRRMQSLGHDLDEIIAQEEEPGLGNGGLGRLASCYMDSLASVEVPAIGYGIRYEFGIFDQTIRDGWQEEITDKWLRFGNPWEIARPEIAYDVNFGGRTETSTDEQGRFRVRWIPETVVKGVAYDTPILGYRVDTCNMLRLWKAEAVESFDFAAFNHGDYYRAVQDKMASENITKVLYPNDEVAPGKELRLKQQFFFCELFAAGHAPDSRAPRRNARDVSREMGRATERHASGHRGGGADAPAGGRTLAGLGRSLECHAHDLRLHQSHPAAEALEKWRVDLFGACCRAISKSFTRSTAAFSRGARDFPGMTPAWRGCRSSTKAAPRYVRMAHLATVGSHTSTAWRELHSELLKQTVLRDFAELWPEKFRNVTNGVTPRRFVALSNPG